MGVLGDVLKAIKLLEWASEKSEEQAKGTENIVEFEIPYGEMEDYDKLDAVVFVDSGTKYEYYPPEDITPAVDWIPVKFEPGEDSATEFYWDEAPEISTEAEVLLRSDEGEMVAIETRR